MVTLQDVKRAKILGSTECIKRIVNPREHVAVRIESLHVEIAIVDAHAPGPVFLLDEHDV